ncbi:MULTISPECIES: septum formation initiator family protein [Aeromicrobium]|jgi:cell division protein FtsB|uniref:FtsB family cell division protein n=1 Tax=Aeromicrobium TaxID=2040 RepID=UPI00082A8FCD|nr:MULTISPECIES: septum formation initiator family protein [Aeromicrobium]
MAGSRGPGRPTPRTRRPAGRPSGAAGASRPGPTRPRSGTTTARGVGSRFTTRAVLLLAVLLLLLASYTSALHAWWQQRGEVQQLKAEIATRQASIEDLGDTKARWNDDAYVRQQARERFGWVMPGEVGYRVIGADGTVEGDAPRLDDPPDPTQKQWYDTLWGSVEASGRTSSAQQPVPDPDEVLKNRD